MHKNLVLNLINQIIQGLYASISNKAKHYNNRKSCHIIHTLGDFKNAHILNICYFLEILFVYAN